MLCVGGRANRRFSGFQELCFYQGVEMKIAIGCDNNAVGLKQAIVDYLEHQELVDVAVKDVGVYDAEPVDYPDIAEKVALAVANGECDRGILICGTGIGMAIAANKVPGVRAAQVYDVYSAERAQKSNNAQIITFGALVTGKALAAKLVEAWLVSEFQGGRSTRKVEKILEIEERYRHG
jgi:ribose 5-phosphate isomerase B